MLRAGAALLLLLGLAACATAPVPVAVPGEAASYLGGQPRVVARFDAREVPAWGELTRSRDALKAVGERTRTVWMGFELDSLDDLKTAAAGVRIVLEGDFPRGAAGLMLDFNGAWRKTAGPGVWLNPKLGLAVSLPRDGLVAVRRGDTGAAGAASGVLRDLDAREVESSDAWISFWNPGEALFGETGGRLLPVRRLDVVLTAQDGGLSGQVLLRFDSERSARAAAVLLKLFAPQVRARLGQDLVWVEEGPTLVGSTLSLSRAAILELASGLVAGWPAEAP